MCVGSSAIYQCVCNEFSWFTSGERQIVGFNSCKLLWSAVTVWGIFWSDKAFAERCTAPSSASREESCCQAADIGQANGQFWSLNLLELEMLLGSSLPAIASGSARCLLWVSAIAHISSADSHQVYLLESHPVLLIRHFHAMNHMEVNERSVDVQRGWWLIKLADGWMDGFEDWIFS